MKRPLGRRGLAAAMGILAIAGASQAAVAQTAPAFDVSAAVRAGEVARSATPLGTTASRPAAALATSAVATVTGAVLQSAPAARVSVALAPPIAREAAWLFQNGWPLYALVDKYSAGAPLDEQANCIATAVYFEARGETVDGQLAVARVIMNRAASGRYPASWCEVVKQPWQFSFVRNGQFPAIDYNSDAWRRAQGVTRLAISNAVPSLSTDVLWYHATYVYPAWGRRLTRVSQIGAHIFYRA